MPSGIESAFGLGARASRPHPKRAGGTPALPAGILLLLLAGCGQQTPAPPPAEKPTAAGSPFRERSRELGLAFEHFNGATGKLYFSEMMGPGVGIFDADGDGDLDLIALQGARLDDTPLDRTLIPPTADQLQLRARFFRNTLREQGRLGFEDATEASGIRAEGYGFGVATGDVDGDGDLDLYILAGGGNQLWRNDGGGRFTDVTARAGVGEKRWSASAIFFDAERDGDLDLYVANYVDFAVENAKPCRALTGAPDYCGPLSHRPVADRYYRNRGDGMFEDATLAAGFAAVQPGAALGVVDGDFDQDGWPDLFVANDGMPNHLWQNRGDGTFEERALDAGASVNAAGQAEANMGIAAGDADNDLDEDLLITHLTLETNTYYRNRGRGFFDDASIASGLGPPSLELTGFGTAWLDLENDGWLDLIAVNGTVKLQLGLLQQGDELGLAQRKQLFRNLGGGRFEEVRDAYLDQATIGRGLAAGDLDDDGDVDVVVANNAGPLEVLLNEAENKGHWLGLRLLGKNGSDALGAEAWIEAEGKKYYRRARSGGSYSSAGDSRVHFGLGQATRVEKIEVRWPDGKKESFRAEGVDRYLTLRQGAGNAL
jgi:hypothetical protein